LAIEKAAANADPEIREWMQKTPPEDPQKAELRQRLIARRRRPKLKRPAKRRPLPDQFFEDVAAAYQGAASAGLPPAKTLAEDSDTPQGTVNRWIGEARDRGYLPRGPAGTVTV
jgi:hypothetical protein